jgi:hypothetical protein
MEKTNYKSFSLFNGIKRVAKWIWRAIYIILAASMIGFSNALYDENKWINDVRGKIQQEQVIEDEDTNY